MRLFAETLLTDLSAEEIVTQLAEPELPLNPDNVESRCRKLVKWGDLVRSIRETRGPTVALTVGPGRGTRCPSWAASSSRSRGVPPAVDSARVVARSYWPRSSTVSIRLWCRWARKWSTGLDPDLAVAITAAGGYHTVGPWPGGSDVGPWTGDTKESLPPDLPMDADTDSRTPTSGILRARLPLAPGTQGQ
ncbi:DUF2397 family protein [Salinispora arenicola]|nr:DUF2397 family protein [Salinispora arenicola]